MRWRRRRHRSLYDPALDARAVQAVRGPRDRRGVVLGALSGMGAEVAALPWDWNRAPRLVVPMADVIFAADDLRRVSVDGERYLIVSVPNA